MFLPHVPSQITWGPFSCELSVCTKSAVQRFNSAHRQLDAMEMGLRRQAELYTLLIRRRRSLLMSTPIFSLEHTSSCWPTRHLDQVVL